MGGVQECRFTRDFAPNMPINYIGENEQRAIERIRLICAGRLEQVTNELYRVAVTENLSRSLEQEIRAGVALICMTSSLSLNRIFRGVRLQRPSVAEVEGMLFSVLGSRQSRIQTYSNALENVFFLAHPLDEIPEETISQLLNYVNELTLFTRFIQIHLSNTILIGPTPEPGSVGGAFENTIPESGRAWSAARDMYFRTSLQEAVINPASRFTQVTGTLRHRPSSDGVNSLRHNLHTMYANCIVRYKGQFVYVRDFDGDSKTVAFVYPITNEGLGESYKTVLYKEDEFDFTFPSLGWVDVPGEGLHYIEIIPGTYLKALSPRNTRLTLFLAEDGDAVKTSAEVNFTIKKVSAIFNRRYLSIEEGLKKGMPCFATSPHLAFQIDMSRKSYSVYLDSLKVGKLLTTTGEIKLDKKFNHLSPFFLKVFPNEFK